MRKVRHIILLIFVSIFLFGCDNSPIYTASVDEEAIVTQNGKVVGEPKEPGLHFKDPFSEKVHIIKKYIARKSKLKNISSDNIEALVLWHIVDS